MRYEPCVASLYRCAYALMNSRLCEKLEAAMAPGDWPSFTHVPDASGKALEAVYRMLDAELHADAAGPALVTASPSAAPHLTASFKLWDGRVFHNITSYEDLRRKLQDEAGLSPYASLTYVDAASCLASLS